LIASVSRTAAVSLFLLGAVLSAGAQTSSSSIGQITVDYGSFRATRSQIDFGNGISMKTATEQYTLTAQTLSIYLPKGKPTGSIPFDHAVATGSGDRQVHVLMSDITYGRSYDLYADKAVLTPEPSRARGARLVMTGHVSAKVDVKAAFARPSVTTVDQLTVLLGPSPDYPILEAEHGHTTIVPAQ